PPGGGCPAGRGGRPHGPRRLVRAGPGGGGPRSRAHPLPRPHRRLGPAQGGRRPGPPLPPPAPALPPLPRPLARRQVPPRRHHRRRGPRPVPHRPPHPGRLLTAAPVEHDREEGRVAGNPYRPGREHTARTHPVVPAIYQTTTFELDDAAYADLQGGGGLHQTWYSRFGNPTVEAAAAEVARLHGASRSLMTSSGMAAIATTLLTLLHSGDTLVAARQVYGDTDDLLTRDP